MDPETKSVSLKKFLENKKENKGHLETSENSRRRTNYRPLTGAKT